MEANPVLTPADLSYLGGLFDGEGYAGLVKHTNKYVSKRKDGTERTITSTTPIMSVGMCDSGPVKFLHLCFGGGYCAKKSPSQDRVVYRWQVSYRKAQAAALQLIPYLKNEAKVGQVQKIIDHYIASGKRRI